MKELAYTLNYEFEENFWWYVGRRRLVFGLLDRFLPEAPRRLLDYGCGTGYTTKLLQKYGEVCGADVSEQALEYCKTRGISGLVNLNVNGLATVAPFQAIIALDVHEHIDDDLAVLTEFRTRLVDNGIVLLTVPAYSWLWGGEDYLSKHKRRYTLASLRRVLREAEFEIVKGTYYNAVLSPAIATTVLYRRWFVADGRTQSNLQPVPAWLNSVLRWIMEREASALQHLSVPFGASIVCVAKKRQAE